MEEEKEVQVEAPAEEPKETPAPEPEETTGEVAEEAPPPKPKKTAQERIDEVIAKQRREERARQKAEQEAEYWRKEALKKEQPKEAPAAPATSDRPRLDQFETTEQYEDALFEWRDRRREKESLEAKRKEEYDKALRSFNERAESIRKEYDDFDDVADNIPLTDALRNALAANEHGPELVYYLGTHAAEHTRILNLPVYQQLVELGRLETKLLLAQQTKKAPEAPKPLNPVGMGGGSDKDPSKMTDDEWYAWKKQQTIEQLQKKYGR